jgi:hypothetical protein
MPYRIVQRKLNQPENGHRVGLHKVRAVNFKEIDHDQQHDQP